MGNNCILLAYLIGLSVFVGNSGIEIQCIAEIPATYVDRIEFLRICKWLLNKNDYLNSYEKAQSDCPTVDPSYKLMSLSINVTTDMTDKTFSRLKQYTSFCLKNKKIWQNTEKNNQNLNTFEYNTNDRAFKFYNSNLTNFFLCGVAKSLDSVIISSGSNVCQNVFKNISELPMIELDVTREPNNSSFEYEDIFYGDSTETTDDTTVTLSHNDVSHHSIVGISDTTTSSLDDECEYSTNVTPSIESSVKIEVTIASENGETTPQGTVNDYSTIDNTTPSELHDVLSTVEHTINSNPTSSMIEISAFKTDNDYTSVTATANQESTSPKETGTTVSNRNENLNTVVSPTLQTEIEEIESSSTDSKNDMHFVDYFITNTEISSPSLITETPVATTTSHVKESTSSLITETPVTTSTAHVKESTSSLITETPVATTTAHVKEPTSIVNEMATWMNWYTVSCTIHKIRKRINETVYETRLENVTNLKLCDHLNQDVRNEVIENYGKIEYVEISTINEITNKSITDLNVKYSTSDKAAISFGFIGIAGISIMYGLAIIFDFINCVRFIQNRYLYRKNRVRCFKKEKTGSVY